MKAAVVRHFGSPDVLQLRDVPVPGTSPGFVRVRVRAIGINYAEIFARLGVYPALPPRPFIPGLEFSGEVDEAGTGVLGLRPGDRVFGCTQQGAYAEYVSVPGRQVWRIPDGMSFEEAAAFGVSYLTAYHGMVTLARIQRGESVLVHAGAGGVGTAALQLARAFGASAIATVGSDAKKAAALAEGAAAVINYRTEDFEEKARSIVGGAGVDVILDSIGGRTMRKGWRLLAPMGRYVLYGFAAASGTRHVHWLRAAAESLAVPLLYPPSLLSRNVGFFAFNLYFLFHKAEYFHAVLDDLFRLYNSGAVKPVIGARFTLDTIRDAHLFLQSRNSTGKVVCTV